LLFDKDELEQLIVGDRPWSVVPPVDLTVSPATRATEHQFSEVDELNADLPYIVLRDGPFSWTSVHLALRKDSDDAW
jgi:hypothetical protein